MLNKLGALGILGILAVLAGLGVITYAAPVVGAGMGLIVVGMGLLLKRGLDQVMGLFGM
ncbi:MAG: hypothetical protein ABEJ55_03895 [Halanaeroarchaeum sp.]